MSDTLQKMEFSPTNIQKFIHFGIRALQREQGERSSSPQIEAHYSLIIIAVRSIATKVYYTAAAIEFLAFLTVDR